MTPSYLQSGHYWLIHRRVCQRIWGLLSLRVRDIIANDTEHATKEFKQFEGNINAVTLRDFEDENYYENDYNFRGLI